MNQLELNWPKIGDTVECDACHGKGWYSSAPATDNENYNDRYQTDHPCTACDSFGYLIIEAFDKAGKPLLVKDYDEGWYEKQDEYWADQGY